jgi:hypothetical protein
MQGVRQPAVKRGRIARFRRGFFERAAFLGENPERFDHVSQTKVGADVVGLGPQNLSVNRLRFEESAGTLTFFGLSEQFGCAATGSHFSPP